MSKPNPKYALHFRWGDFELHIVGRRTILWWTGVFSFLVSVKVFGAKLLSVLLTTI